MAFQSVPETAQAAVEIIVNNVTCVITLYARKTGGYDEAALDQLAASVDTWVGNDLMPQLSNQASYVKTEVRGLENAEDLVVQNADSARVGGVASNPLPNNCALCLKRLSSFTGRSARGRVYIPGIPTTVLTADENFMTGTFVIDMVTVMNSLSAEYAGTGWVDVIVSRYTNGVKRATGVTLPVSVWANTDTRIDSQRRRLPQGS